MLSSGTAAATNNMLGDAYGAAVVEALSKKELQDTEQQEEAELIRIYIAPPTESSNGSSVKVREVRESPQSSQADLRSSLFQEILTDTSNSDED